MAVWLSHICASDPYEGVWPPPSFEQKEGAEQLQCKTCKSQQFLVMQAGYSTYIKCPKCGWEESIHTG